MTEHSQTSTPGTPREQVGVSCSLGSCKRRMARRVWRILRPVVSVVVVGLFAYAVWDAARPVAHVRVLAAVSRADRTESIDSVPLPQSLPGTVVSLDESVKIRLAADANQGDREASGTALLSLPPFFVSCPARNLAVLVTLTPRQAWRTGLGRRAHLAFDGRQKACEGIVESLYGSLDQTGGRFEARISLADAPSCLLLPGMKARVSFRDSDMDRERRSIVLIPRDALIGNDGDHAAFWVIGADNLLQQRQAFRRPAWDDGARVAVLGGVRPGEPVVLSPDASLREGQRVTTD